MVAIELALQLVAFVLWASSGGEARPAGRVVLCLGDSLTFGLGAEPAAAYPPRLQSALRQRGAQWSVVNAGIPGQNSADRAVRRATVTDTEMLAILGGHVRLAIELCRAQGTELVLLGYPFAMPRHEEAMQQIAATEQVPFVSMVAPFAGKLAGSARSDWFGDEIHCTTRGYELMASLVADRIAAIRR